MIVVDDFIMLGTTVPEPQTRSGRVFVCSAGYSPQLRQLVRVYPLARRNVPHRWHTYRVPLERPAPQDDSREESWKVAGDRTPGAHERINEQFVDGGLIKPETRAALLARLVVPSIADLNDRRASLGIIFPTEIRAVVEHQPDHPDSALLQLFEREDPTPARHPAVPRLVFSDGAGQHRLMVRDWGVFELMRKRGPEFLSEHLSPALHLSRESALLVGNLSHQRNAWLVISVLNGLRVPTLDLEFA